MTQSLAFRLSGGNIQPTSKEYDATHQRFASDTFKVLRRNLSPDGQGPYLYRWVAEGPGVVLRSVDLSGPDLTWTWAKNDGPDAQVLTVGVEGETLTATYRQRTWRIQYGTRELLPFEQHGAFRYLSRDELVGVGERAEHTLSRAGVLVIRHDRYGWLLVHPELHLVSRSSTGEGKAPLPERVDGQKVAVQASLVVDTEVLSLGCAQAVPQETGATQPPRDRIWFWRFDENTQAIPSFGFLAIETNVSTEPGASRMSLDGPPAGQPWIPAGPEEQPYLRVVRSTDFTGVRVVQGATARATFPIDRDPRRRVLDATLRFTPAVPGESPGRLSLSVSSSGSQTRVTATLTEDLDGGAYYALDRPIRLSRDHLPVTITLRPEGQEAPAGQIIGVPAWFSGTWRPPDPGSMASDPAFGPTDLQVQEHEGGWTPATGGALVVPIGAMGTTAVIIQDNHFEPLLLREPKPAIERFWNRGMLSPKNLKELRLWAPRQAPLDLGTTADGRLADEPNNIRGLMFACARSRQVLRLSSDRGPRARPLRGVVWPTHPGSLPTEWQDPASWLEVPASGGVHNLVDSTAGARFLLWFRGLLLPCRLQHTETSSELLLEEPLDCSGGMGLDVGPFLPMRIGRLDADHPRLRLRAGLDWCDVEQMRGHWADAARAEPLEYDYPGFGLFAGRPQPDVPCPRLAWRGLIWSWDGETGRFHGWSLRKEGGFRAASADPWHAYGFTLESVEEVQRLFGPARPVPEPAVLFHDLPAPIQQAVRRLMQPGATDLDPTIHTDEGAWHLSTHWHTPPVKVEVTIRRSGQIGGSNAGAPQIRVFRLALAD